MFVLTWNHTRKGTPMRATFPSFGQAWLRAAMIRHAFPQHPMQLNGKPL